MSQFGIQMYTLRETMKTPEDYETTLRRWRRWATPTCS